jgi:cell shape-determining protein MreD
MKGTAAVLGTVLAAIAQVTVAPLFPVSAAVPEFVLLALVIVAAFGNPRRAMVCVPVAAIAYGFLSDRSPALLLLAYLPLLPLGLYLEEARVPLNHYARTLVAALATGLWIRALLMLGTVVGGADATLGAAVGQVLVPGLFLDFALLSVVYVPLRLIGWSGQGMSLQRGSYYSSL